MNIDFENLNKFQKNWLKGMVERKNQRDELAKPVRDYYEKTKTYIIETHIITEEIIVAEMKNPFETEDLSHYESFYEVFVNGKKVLETGTFSLDGAILLGIAAKYGEPKAYPFMGKMIDLKAL